MNNNMQQGQGMAQSSKIQNPETQVPKTPQMSERDFLNDMLSTEKYMSDSYSITLNEASHEQLYSTLENVFLETQRCQRDLFNLMFKKGWYSFDAENAQTLTQSYQQFTGYKSQFPYGAQGGQSTFS